MKVVRFKSVLVNHVKSGKTVGVNLKKLIRYVLSNKYHIFRVSYVHEAVTYEWGGQIIEPREYYELKPLVIGSLIRGKSARRQVEKYHLEVKMEKVWGSTKKGKPNKTGFIGVFCVV